MAKNLKKLFFTLLAAAIYFIFLYAVITLVFHVKRLERLIKDDHQIISKLIENDQLFIDSLRYAKRTKMNSKKDSKKEVD